MSSRIQETVHRSYTSKPKYSEIMSGLPEDYKQIKTLGDLLNICYKHVTVQEQMRSNLIAKLKKGEHPFPGIIGYDDDVVPAINRAILSGHGMRSEEHTSELQSRQYLVCRLLLEKKKYTRLILT